MFPELGSLLTNLRISPSMIIVDQSLTTTFGDISKLLTTNSGVTNQPLVAIDQPLNFLIKIFIKNFMVQTNIQWSSSDNLWPPPSMTPSGNFRQPTPTMVANYQPWNFVIKTFLGLKLISDDRCWPIFNHNIWWLY